MDTYFPKTRRPTVASTRSSKSLTSEKPKDRPASIVPIQTPKVVRPQKSKTTTATEDLQKTPTKDMTKPSTPSHSPTYVDVTPPKARLLPSEQHRPVKKMILEPPGAPKKARQKPAVFRKLFQDSKTKDIPNFDLSSPIKVFNNNNNNNNNDTSHKPLDDPDSSSSSKVKRILKLDSPIKRKEFTSPLKTKTATPSSAKIEDGPLKGVSTKILEFVRAKEAAAMNITPEQERRKELLGIAPELARIVPTIFTASKRDILPYNKIIETCSKSLKMNYTAATIEECLKLMDTIAYEWTSTVTISRGKFMRLNKDRYTVPQLLDAIKRFKQKNC